MKRYPEIILATLAQINPKCGQLLLEEIFSTIFPDFMDNVTSHIKIIEYIWKNNLELLVRTFADICKKDNNSLNLSRILDISQAIRNSLPKLTETEDYEFSIPLGLFASKREFLNPRIWVKERIENAGERFIEALISYIRIQVLTPVKNAMTAEFNGQQISQKRLDAILENAHLNSTSLNTIMEGLNQATSSRENYSERITKKIEDLHTELSTTLLERFSPTSTPETEVESNKLLADVYEGRITMEAFLARLTELMNSQRNNEQEIFACIVHNLFAEYPHYNRQSRPAVELTGKIFGNLIKDKIISNVTYKVCLQSILEALKKKDKLFLLGVSALQVLKSMIHENLAACKNIFEIDQLREHHSDILWEILQNLKKTDNIEAIDETYVKEIESKHRAREDAQAPSRPEVVAPKVLTPAGGATPTSPERVLERPPPPPAPAAFININEIETTSLSQEINKRFKADTEGIYISEEDKNGTIFIMNSLDRERLEEKAKALGNKLTEADAISWFSCLVVWNRVLADKQFLDLYVELVNKINKKALTKKVIHLTYHLVNLVFEYATFKKQLTAEEMNNVRCTGTWLGLITLGSNRPILKKDLDVKMRLYKSFENKSLKHTIPMVGCILTSITQSTLFKINNPYVMGILGMLIEIKAEHGPRDQVTILIEQLFTSLKVNERDVKHFGYIQRRKNAKQNNNLTFMVKCLPEYITIDTRTLESYTVSSDIDLKQLVAIAVDLSVKELTQPNILQRSVFVALTTTRELIFKDFAFEGDEEKFTRSSEAMITKLAGNLALVTSTDMLKNAIKEHLDTSLEAQTQLPERSRKAIKDIAAQDNLNLACNIIRKIVVEKALQELSKDKLYLAAIEKRRIARERNEMYCEKEYLQLLKNMPPSIKPHVYGLTKDDMQIYANFRTPDQNSLDDELDFAQTSQRRAHPINNTNSYPVAPVQQPARQPEVQTPPPPERRTAGEGRQQARMSTSLDESKIINLLGELERQLNQTTSDRTIAIHQIYIDISKLLQSTKDVENHIFSLAQMILNNLFNSPQQFNTQKLVCYSDVLAIYSQYNPKLSKNITDWFFNLQSDNKWNHSTLVLFLRRNLMYLADFDANYATVLETLDASNLQPLDCIVQVLKGLVIEQKIFAIYTFKKIVEKLIAFQRKRIFMNVSPDASTFIENLAEFMRTNNDYLSSIKFRLTNIEPEYKKLLTDVEEYFHKPDFAFYKQSIALFKKFLNSKNQTEMGDFIKSFEEEITRKNDDVTTCFFCYIIDVSCKRAERFYNASGKVVKLDYTYIDQVSKMVTILMKTMISTSPKSKTNLLEKILTAIIIVLTKEHVCNANNFNNKLFFKLLFNILYDLSRAEYDFGGNIISMLQTIVQALHILQPIKYPGFAFAWLQLISSKFLMAPLLRDKDKEVWHDFNSLILDLIIFYKEVFTAKSMNTPEMRAFYKGTLQLLLVLLHDFPDFLCHFSFCLLEEIPETFMQVKNIIVSAFPKGMKIGDPFESDFTGQIDMNDEYNRLPLIHHKVEERINCHNLHNLISKCIKTPEQNDFDQIMKSFYISGYKNDTHINKMLLDSFVLYVPYFIYNQPDNNDVRQVEDLKHDSYMLFVKLIRESDFELRDAIISSMLNNLRYPNLVTFYFTNLILLIFTEVDNDIVHEQIVRNLFERLIIEKPHPWGTLYLLDKLFTDQRYHFEAKPFYQKNNDLMDSLTTHVLDFVKIAEANANQDEE